MKKSLLVLLIASAVLAACDNGDKSGNGVKLEAVVKDAFAQTSETALPFDINVLDIDASDETPTLYDGLLV